MSGVSWGQGTDVSIRAFDINTYINSEYKCGNKVYMPSMYVSSLDYGSLSRLFYNGSGCGGRGGYPYDNGLVGHSAACLIHLPNKV